jgi:hypothetical protein
MDQEQLLDAAKKILEKVRGNRDYWAGIKAEVCEFLRLYAGPKTSFYDVAEKAAGVHIREHLATTMESYISFVTAGLYGEISPERKAQLDVVSDLLEQCHTLLENEKVHPAAPAVLIGATLEEFLRNWVEGKDIPLAGKKAGLDTYCKLLREAELISKQDTKDITSWAGIRNHAAHGEWEEVSDRNRIQLMLEGVNLFMRKCTTG